MPWPYWMPRARTWCWWRPWCRTGRGRHRPRCHTTVVVSAPGMGDDVQAVKAGILEIADIHVVNKADRPDANRTTFAN